MTSPAGPFLDVVAQRTRDAEFMATPIEGVMRLMSESMRAWNTRVGDNLVELPLVLEPSRVAYGLEGELPLCARPIAVRDRDGRSLDRIPFEKFARLSFSWFRQAYTRLFRWATVGRDLLVIHPAMRDPQPVTVIAHKLTDMITSRDDATDIDDDQMPMVLYVTECLVELRMRRLPRVAQMLEGIKAL